MVVDQKSHHYVVSVQQPTAVTHCIKGHFLSPSSVDVVVAKTSKLELYSVAESGLIPVYEVPIYGRIAALSKCHCAGNGEWPAAEGLEDDKDHIIVYTDDYYFTVLV